MQDTTLPSNDKALCAFAHELADLARSISMQYFRTELDVLEKDDLSPVTIADRAVEAAMRERIAQVYPDHGIYGEEQGQQGLDRAHIWVVDPIDGTKSFVTGMPTFGTLIAHLEEGTPDLGLISIPPTGECWTGQVGMPTTFGSSRCVTSGCASLADARFYTTSPDIFDETGSRCFEALSRRARMRRFGGDCYAYGLLASGHVDAVFEMDLQPYDYMALVPVVEGAGGVITDWQGRSLTLESDGRVIAAATRELHREMLEIIATVS